MCRTASGLVCIEGAGKMYELKFTKFHFFGGGYGGVGRMYEPKSAKSKFWKGDGAHLLSTSPQTDAQTPIRED